VQTMGLCYTLCTIKQGFAARSRDILMLLRISLFHLIPNMTLDQIPGDLPEPYGGQRFGIFQPQGMETFDAAEVSRLDFPAVGSLPEGFWDQSKSTMDVWLEPMPGGFISPQRIPLQGRFLRVFFYEPHPEHAEEEFVGFIHRIAPRYNEFIGQIGWHYIGTFRAHGFSQNMRAAITLIEAPSIEEALARDAALIEPPDIAAITAQGRALMRQDHVYPPLWLTPHALTPLSQSGLVF